MKQLFDSKVTSLFGSIEALKNKVQGSKIRLLLVELILKASVNGQTYIHKFSKDAFN